VSTLHIVYQHTSHGSQLVTGMDALAAFPDFDGRYAWDDGGATPARSTWTTSASRGGPRPERGRLRRCRRRHAVGRGTRALLDDPANAHVNVVMWSWCSINGHDAQRYVDNMEKLVAEYPDVTFVFMTGHSEGQGEDSTPNGIHYNNELIRRHCREHGRWLFDSPTSRPTTPTASTSGIAR